MTITRRFIVEVMRGSHLYVKLGRREMFVSFARDGGPARRPITWDRCKG